MFIQRWLKWLFRFSESSHRKRPSNWPTKEEIAALPPFEALKLWDIVKVDNAEIARQAFKELSAETVVGFDTESKPTFRKGEVSTGPHIVQFSTSHRAYIFLLHDPECRKTAGALIALRPLMKVGFGLRDDLRRIQSKMHVEPQNVWDLETLFREKGFGRGVGVKVGLALLFKRRFLKSKKASTSNWSRPALTDAQILYAGNDAFAAICAYHALARRK